MKEVEKKDDVKDKHKDHRDDHHHEHGHQHEVEITINGKEFKIKKGVYTVEQLKRLGHVPPEDSLSKFENGQLIELADNARIEIHGCEVFASHVRSCGSS